MYWPAFLFCPILVTIFLLVNGVQAAAIAERRAKEKAHAEDTPERRKSDKPEDPWAVGQGMYDAMMLNGYGEVVISWDTDLNGVTVKVDDSGPGIPAAAREVVFEQFYRLSEGPTAQLGGTGLGLWRVREIAEKRGGKVWVEDSPKGGAGLRLRFPL